MSHIHRFFRILSLSYLSLATIGCAYPIAVSPGLTQNTERFPLVKLDRKSWNFGDHQVREIRRGWEKGTSVSNGLASGSKKSRDFSFAMLHGDVSLQVNCKLTGSEATVLGFKVDDDEQVLCDLNPSDATPPWKVVLVRRGAKNISGRMQQGEQELQIIPAHGSGHSGSRGYLIRHEGDIAAADVGGKKTRAMWLPKEAAPALRLALAGTSTLLMILEDIK